jgi:hypothetical protein
LPRRLENRFIAKNAKNGIQKTPKIKPAKTQNISSMHLNFGIYFCVFSVLLAIFALPKT